MKFTTAITISLMAVLMFGCTKKEPAPQPAPANNDAPAAIEPKAPTPSAAGTEKLSQKAAPLDGLTYVKGSPVTLQGGKVYVVEFWATWCPPCLKSIPHLTELQKQYKDKGVTIIGVSVDMGDDYVADNKDLDQVKGFVAKRGEQMNYTVAWDGVGKVTKNYMDANNPKGTIPFAVIVDGAGTVAWVGHPMDGLDEVLELVVAGTFDPEAYAKAKAERQAAERELHKLFQEYNGAVLMGATIEKTRPIAEKIIASNNPMALNALAWQILSIPSIDGAKRDTEIALKAAAKANTETNGEDPMILDIYALALSKTGKLEEAIAAQQKAIDLSAGNERIQADMKIRLEQFKAALEPPVQE